MKALYFLLIGLLVLSSCSNSEEKKDIEIIKIPTHYFYIEKNSKYVCFKLDAILKNNTKYKFSDLDLVCGIKFIYPKKKFILYSPDIYDRDIGHTWLPNDTIHVKFDINETHNGFFHYEAPPPTIELLDYTPQKIILFMKISASDVIGNKIDETYASLKNK